MQRFRNLKGSYHARRVFGIAAAVAAILGAAFAAIFLIENPVARTILIFVVSFGVLLAIFASVGVIYLALREHDTQVRSLVNLRPLYGAPLRTGGWAADPHMLESVVLLLQEKQPVSILELGSGASTVVIAEFLRSRGTGRLVSVDHEARFAEATRAQLKARGLESFVDIVVAPLSRQRVNGRPCEWYTADWKRCIGQPVDFLVVDGPPARTQKEARYPAFPLLAPFLAAGCTIVLDDGSRADERTIANEWAASCGCKARFAPMGKGMWVLENVTAPGPAA